MPTNLPGVTSYGIPLFGQGSVYDMPAGRVWFVCNRTGATSTSAPAGTSRDAPFASLADAVANVTTTLPTTGDVIYVLPGHAENVTGSNLFSGSATLSATAAVFPAGLRIIGEGSGNQRPTFTFTAAGSVLTLASAGVTLENLVLLCPQTGTTTVAVMVAITGAACGVINCTMQMASSATALATRGITTSSTADDVVLVGNKVWGTAAGTPVAWYAPVGTAGSNRCFVFNNDAQLTLSSTTGALVDCSANTVTPPLNQVISFNRFTNEVASSTVAIKGCAGATGIVSSNRLGVITTGTAAITRNSAVWFTPDNIASLQTGGNVAVTG